MTRTETQKLTEALAYYRRIGNAEMVHRTLRLLNKTAGSYTEHYNRRFREMMTIPTDQLI